MPLPTLGQMIAALGSPPEWTAIDPSKLLWDNVNSILYINGEPVGGGFFVAGVKDHHFYNDEVEVGVIESNPDYYNRQNVGFGNNALAGSSHLYYDNVALGDNALSQITTEGANVAIGAYALGLSDVSGGSNVAIGEYALHLNTVGEYNVAIGPGAMYERTDADDNVAIGTWALFGVQDESVKTGSVYFNVAIGDAMDNFCYGDENIAIGFWAFADGAGDYNTVIGESSLGSVVGYWSDVDDNVLEESYQYGQTIIGHYSVWGWREFNDYDENTTIGYETMSLGHVAASNTVIGNAAFYECYGGELNVVIGHSAFESASNEGTLSETYLYWGPRAADCNVIVGAYAGRNVINSNYSTFLGYDTSVQGAITSTMTATYTEITPSPGLSCFDYTYGVSFVFDDGSESNLIMMYATNSYVACYDNSYPLTKTYQINLANIPVCPATYSPKICVARNIYRVWEAVSEHSHYVDKEDRENDYKEWTKYRFVDSIDDNSTTTFSDTMTSSILLTQPLFAGVSNSIALGAKTQIVGPSQLVVGGSEHPIKEVWFGRIFSSSPIDFTLNPTGGYGANKAGANLILAGGRGTGTANGGSIKFQVTPASGSSSYWNVLEDALVIDDAKIIQEFCEVVASGTPQLGTNCPAVTAAAPYTWWRIKTTDGSVGYVPIWK